MPQNAAALDDRCTPLPSNPWQVHLPARTPSPMPYELCTLVGL